MAGLLIALELAGLAYWQRSIAIQQEQIAEEQRKVADQQRGVAEAARAVAEENEAEAKRQRDSALLTQSRFLADLAAQNIAAGDTSTAILLALEALPDQRAGVARPYAAEAEVSLFSALQVRPELRVLSALGGPMRDGTFSPDGRRVLAVSEDMAVLWDTETGTTTAALIGHDGPISRALFSPDGRHVLTASADTTARLWDAQSGKAVAVLRGHERPVRSVAFSPDRRLAVTGSDDGTVRLWNAVSGEATLVIDGHKQSDLSAA